MVVSQVYVDPAINADSGAGTIGDPYGDLQYALNTHTQTAGGDQFNVKAGTAEAISSTLSLATYGTPSYLAPLVIRGYTATAGDGGRGAITANGVSIFNQDGGKDFCFLIDLDMTQLAGGWAYGVALHSYSAIINCSIIMPDGPYALLMFSYSIADRCYFYCGRSGVSLAGNFNSLRNCYLNQPVNANSANQYMIASSGSHEEIIDNIIRTANSGVFPISATGWLDNISGNICCNSAAGTKPGIYTGGYYQSCYNNIVCGQSGSGGIGIDLGARAAMAGFNATWNNTTAFNGATDITNLGGNVALTANPFTDAANGDFSMTDAAKTALRSWGWPETYRGAHANSDPHITIGPMQYGPTPTGGGGAVSISPARGNL